MSSPPDPVAAALTQEDDSDDSDQFLDAVYREVRDLEESGCGTFNPNRSVEEMEKEVREAAEEFERKKEETKEK